MPRDRSRGPGGDVTDAWTYAVPGRARPFHYESTTSGRKRWAAGGVATMIAVGAFGVLAPPAAADVRSGRTVEVFHGRNIVAVDGYPANTEVKVDVLRGDAVIGTATYTTDEAGFFEINHLGDGDCWQSTYTPNILPGDVVRTSIAGEAAQDTTATRDVFIEQKAEFVAPDIIRVKGHAKDTPAAPFQLGDIVELRMNKVSRTNGWETNDGRRDLRLADIRPFVNPDGTYTHDFKVSVDDWNDAQRAGIDISTVWIRGASELTFYDGEPEATVGCPPLMPDDLVPPSQVTGVLLAQPSVGVVELDWSAATDNDAVTGYVVTRTNVESGVVATYQAGNELFWSQTRVPTGRYTYSVHAVDATGNAGAKSADVLVGVGVDAPPAAPTAVTATATGSSIDLSWTAPAEGTPAVSYQVLRGTTVVADVVNGTTYTDANRPVGTHTYTVKSRSADGTLSAASEVASAEVLTPPDTTAPVVGTLSGTASGASATLTWPAASDAVGVTGYRVLRNGTQVGTDLPADARTLTDSGLAEGPHSYTLRAFDAAGNVSDPSNAVSLTIDTTAPGVSGQSPAANATGVPLASDVTATFGEAVTGVSGTSFTLRAAGSTTDVAATVAYNTTTRVATLNPTADLAASTQYTATLTGGATAIRDAAGNPLAGTSWTFTTGVAPDTTAPTVSGRAPVLNATGVPVAGNVTATFSEAVVGVSGTTVTLRPTNGTANVGATVTYDTATRVATLDPTADLAFSTQYTATLTGGATAIRDAANNPLGTTSWTFTTAAAPDTTAPTVTGRTPVVGATGVAVGSNVTATFSEAVQGVSGTTVTLRPSNGTTSVGAAVTYNATTRVATLDPTANLAAGTQYTATLTGGATAIRDAANNSLSTTSWTFTTAAGADTTAPTVSSRTPVNNATGINRNANLTVTFSEAMNTTSISSTTVVLRGPAGGTIAASVTRDGTTNRWIINPNLTLNSGARYTLTLTGGSTGIRDLAGNGLVGTTAQPLQTAFTTGSAL